MTVYDPVAIAEAKRVLALDFEACRRQQLQRFALQREIDAMRCGADALVIVTEWKAFRSPDFEQVKRTSKRR